MTPGTCYKLDIFINEVTSAQYITQDQRATACRELTQLALQGDCQFNCRCRQWKQCPMAKQTRPKPCSRFFTEEQRPSYQQRNDKRQN